MPFALYRGMRTAILLLIFLVFRPEGAHAEASAPLQADSPESSKVESVQAEKPSHDPQEDQAPAVEREDAFLDQVSKAVQRRIDLGADFVSFDGFGSGGSISLALRPDGGRKGQKFELYANDVEIGLTSRK